FDAGPDQAWAGNDEFTRLAGDHLQHYVAGDCGEAGSSDRIDVTAEAEIPFDKGLHARSGTTKARVPQPDNDMVARVEIAVDDVDDDRFLKWPFVALLVEATAQRLNRCRLLFRQ